jgi:hypothetical protein
MNIEKIHKAVDILVDRHAFNRRDHQLYNLLIFNEKHGNRMFVITSIDDIFKIGLKILNERLDLYKCRSIKNPPAPLEFDESNIAALPETLRGLATNQLKSYNALLKQYKLESTWDILAEYAASHGDGKVAFYVLFDRLNYTNEDFEFINSEKF